MKHSNSKQVIQDATSKLQASENLTRYMGRSGETAKGLDQFLCTLSHDLKAPLRAISNLSLWIQEDIGASLTEECSKNFEMLRSRVLRMEAMINGLSEYAKIGKQHFTNEPVDVCALLAEVVSQLSVPAHIKVEIKTEMPVLTTSKIALSKIFSSLIDNAIKYNDKEAGSIKLLSSDKGDHFEFTVEDNGPGVGDNHEQIFMIFQTLQSKDKLECTGIGLTIVKRILEDYGEKIRVESNVGIGTKFIFTWSNF